MNTDQNNTIRDLDIEERRDHLRAFGYRFPGDEGYNADKSPLERLLATGLQLESVRESLDHVCTFASVNAPDAEDIQQAVRAVRVAFVLALALTNIQPA